MSNTPQHSSQKPTDAATLRKKAEEQARTMAPISLSAQTPEAIEQMLHELQVHQIELEMQNEELRRAQAEIEDGRERYFDLYDLAPVGYCTLSEKGLILEANLTAAILLGVARRTLINKPISRFILKEDQDIYFLHRRQLFETGEPQQYDLRLVKADGTLFWANLIGTAAQGEDGGPVCRIAISDITERKRAEAQLADNEQRYRTLAYSGQALIWTSGTNKQCDYFNRTWLAFTGRSFEQEVGDGWTEGVHAEDFHRCLTTYVAAFDRREPFSMEYRLRHCSGAYRWIQDDGTPRFDAQGRFLGYIGHCLDITERKQAEQALRTSEEYLQSTLDALVAHIAVLNEHGEIVLTNKAYRNFAEQNGIDPAVVSEGTNYLTACDTASGAHSQEASSFAEGIREALLGKHRRFELEYPCHSPEAKRWFVGRVTPIQGEGPRRVVVTHEDITERKLAENEVRLSESLFRTLVNTIPDLIWLKDADGVYLACNKRFERFFGASETEICGKTDYDFVDKELADSFRDNDRKALAVGGLSKNDEQITDADDGHTIFLETIKTPMFGSDGNLVGVLGIGRDISERKQADEAMRESEKRFKALHNASFGGIAIHDQGVILECNQGLSEISGFSTEELIGMDGLLLISEKTREKVLKNIQDGYEKPYEAIGLRKNNDEYPVRLEARNIPYKGKNVRVVEFRDITEAKQAEEEREKLQSQLQRAQKMEAIGTLAGGIAHDFNNILGAILGYAELAQEDSPPRSVLRKDITQIIKASHRATELVKQILAFSRQAETERIPLRPAPIIKEALKMLRSSLPSTIAIVQDIDQKAGPLLADPTQIHQIVVNLCTNAFHAMEKTGGTLSISLKSRDLSRDDIALDPHVHPGRFVQLSIGDTGPGIAPEILEKIFEPYFTTKEVGKGTGMGLAIVHGIAKSYQGFVSCHSVFGQGTVFHVYLPLIAEPASLEIESAPLERMQRGNERILLVDDEEILAEMGQVMLERLGYQVTVSRNSLEALHTFQAQPDQFDLVITDQTMPGMTGMDMARRMLQIRPGMPIILCTGFSHLVDEELAKSCGIKNFMMKPLAKKELAAVLRQVLDDCARP